MKLCLNAIVRNESAQIERMLKSVAPHIACAVIVDTGSTDDTKEKILSFCEDRRIPCEIQSVPFKNFEQARNAALDAARTSVFDFDAMLLCDADMELVVTSPDWLRDKNGLSYDMRQTAGTLSYHNRRIISRSATGYYKGVTHEYLDVHSAGFVDGAYFLDHADGANRPEKFKRDIALLEEALREEPNNERYWFYLAQSYRDAGEFAKAASAYKRRVELGGWDEEVWNAQFNYAHCLGSMDDSGGLLRELLIAYNMRPHRAEVLYDLAKLYREMGMNEVSLLFSEAGLNYPYPRDVLFVSDYVYNTGLKEEFSIAGFYKTRTRPRAYDLCNELALQKEGTAYSREQARFNLYFYIEPLAQMVEHFSAHRIAFDPPGYYVPMNPSLIWDNGIRVIVRTVNYTITPEGTYSIRSTNGTANRENPIHTRNFLLRLNGDYTIDTCSEIIHANKPPVLYDLVVGFEDMRLFKWNNQLWTSSTVRDMNIYGQCEQVLARIIHDGSEDHYYVDNIQKMSDGSKTEKNWMPFVQDKDLRFVYQPGTLVDWAGGIVTKTEPKQDLNHLRGGSQVVNVKGMYLAITHEARVRPDNGQRYYFHRFLRMDKNGEILGVSKPFVFNQKQIEFAAGMATDPSGENVYISYGVRDCEAWIAKVDVNSIVKLLDA